MTVGKHCGALACGQAEASTVTVGKVLSSVQRLQGHFVLLEGMPEEHR